MKKKTKLFKHFITLLNCLALSVPLVILVITYLSDVSTRYFSSLSVSHSQTNGGFEDDLDYSFSKNTLPSINDYLFKTMDNVGYLDYELNGYRQVEYHTNEVNSIDDLVVGNVYQFQFTPILDTTISANFGKAKCYHFIGYKYFSDNDLYLNIRTQTNNYNTNSVGGITDNISSLTMKYLLFPSVSYYDNNIVKLPFIYMGGLPSNFQYLSYIKIADLSLIPPTFVNVEGVDNLQDYEELIEGKSYDYIINNSVNTNMLVNFDFGKIFFNSNMINQNGNIAPYLFLNYMINYFINISLFLFIPEFIICFFYMLRTMTYKLVDKEV